MDRSQLSSLKRPQLQHLARRENMKANLKNVEIIRLLLEKYPDGVPELAGKPSMLKSPIPSSSKAKQPARRSRRRSLAKSGPFPIKAEETVSNVHVEASLDEPDIPRKGRNARSMAPPPVTPTASFHLPRPPLRRRLPTTPLIDTVFGTQGGGETDEVANVHDTTRSPKPTQTPPEVAAATSHQVHKMLRSLTEIIDTASLNPEETSSMLYRAKALNTILDIAIIPRMMKVDKDVKDIVWTRVALEKHLGPRFKENGILPGSRRSEIPNVRSGHFFPAAPLSPPKRQREETGDEVVPPLAQQGTPKRARV